MPFYVYSKIYIIYFLELEKQTYDILKGSMLDIKIII